MGNLCSGGSDDKDHKVDVSHPFTCSSTFLKYYPMVIQWITVA